LSLFGLFPTSETKPRLLKNFNNYTNFFVTICRADGMQKLVMCFTYNPAFRSQAQVDALPPGQKAAAQVKHNLFIAECAARNINIDCIKYISEDNELRKNKTTQYCAEKREYYKIAIKHFQDAGMLPIADDIWWIHDAGTEFKEKASAGGTPILVELGYKKIVILFPDSHHAMSTCDNAWHGTAKKTARAAVGCQDDLKWTLQIIHQLQEVPPATLAKWFRRNMFWDVVKTDADALQSHAKILLNKTPAEWMAYHDVCVDALYGMFPALEAEGFAVPPSSGRRQRGRVVIVDDEEEYEGAEVQEEEEEEVEQEEQQ